VRAASALLLAALAALALGACETTQEKSARLEKLALAKKANAPLGAEGLKIDRPSRDIHVLGAIAVHSSEGTAVAVKLGNTSSKAEAEVPLLVTLRGSGGASLYSNSAPGIATSLIAVPYVPAHGTTVWIDDQISSTEPVQRVETKVGEGRAVTGPPPKVEVTGWHRETEPGGITLVAGNVANRSKVDQHEVLVTALALRGGRILAAGRSVIPVLPAGSTGRFQIFLLGEARSGAKLAIAVSPSTFG
jgi:hypothetical protein